MIFLLFYYIDIKKQILHRKLCALVSDTPLGIVLLSVRDEEQCDELYKRYLHDFVRSVHKCTHKTEEIVTLEYQVFLSYISLFAQPVFGNKHTSGQP